MKKPAPARKPSAPHKAPETLRPEPATVVAGTNDPDTALLHLQALLEAKQERVRQGPSYPSANAHTGRSDSGKRNEAPHSDIDPHAADTVTNHPSPDATYGANGSHARGNQAMRKQC